MKAIPKSRIKILFILPSLKSGGAERVISFIASHLDKQKFESVLVVIGKAEDSVYSTENIETIFLNKSRVAKSAPWLMKYFLLKKPNIVVGSISHVNRLIAMFAWCFPNIKFVGREASVLSIMNTFSNTNRKISMPFFKNYFKQLDAVICQSNDMANDLQSTYNFPESKIQVINNPISGNLPIKQKRLKKDNISHLITVGRLSNEKGHERILKALAKVDFDFRYTIIGKGAEHDSIFELAKSLKISEKIHHIEHTDDVAKYLAENDVFIQGSYVEGFPNALLESCVVGTPVLAFNAPGGTKEIIDEGINGYIVKNESEFIQKINAILLQKGWDPNTISQSVIKKFNKDHILKQYEELFTKLANS